MRNLSLLTTFVMALAAAPSYAASFTFETTGTGSYSSLTLTDSGLTMTLTRDGGNFSVSDVAGASEGWGDRTVENSAQCGLSSCPAGDFYNANFSSGISFFRIQFGDFNADDDTPVTLRAYSGADGTGTLLGTVNEIWLGSDSFPDFGVLSFGSATPILSVQFTAGGAFTNTLFWDNITTREDLSAIPEPATLLLIGFGLAAAAYRRRRV
jgi:hypothetical protein